MKLGMGGPGVEGGDSNFSDEWEEVSLYTGGKAATNEQTDRILSVKS